MKTLYLPVGYIDNTIQEFSLTMYKSRKKAKKIKLSPNPINQIWTVIEIKVPDHIDILSFEGKFDIEEE